jgi:hypothetical protein
MKRLLGVCLLMSMLSLPAFGGHTVPGDNSTYCDCNTPGCLEDYPGECNGRVHSASTEAPDDSTAEWGIVLVGLLLWLRLKA